MTQAVSNANIIGLKAVKRTFYVRPYEETTGGYSMTCQTGPDGRLEPRTVANPADLWKH